MAKTKVHGEYLDPSVISGQTQVTAVGADSVLILDATDNSLKKALLSDVIETIDGGAPTFTTATISGSNPVLNIARTSNYTYKIGSLANDTFAIQSNETTDASYVSLIEIDSFAHQGSSPAIKVDSSGNVGIGGSPGAKLDVNTGTVNTLAHFHSTDDNAFIELKDDDTTGYIGVQNDYVYVGGAPSTNTQNLVIHKTSGNVGIRWTAPTARLGILQNGSTTPGMNITDGATADFRVFAGYVSGTTRIGTSAGHLAIDTAGTERARISSSGKVSIGTTSTDHQLSINAADFDGIQLLQGGTDTGYIGVYHDGSSTGRVYVGALSTIDFQTGNGGATDGTSRVRIDGNNVFLNGGTDARIQLGTGGAGANQVSNNTVHIRGDNNFMKLNAAASGGIIMEINGGEGFYLDPNHWIRLNGGNAQQYSDNQRTYSGSEAISWSSSTSANTWTSSYYMAYQKFVEAGVHFGYVGNGAISQHFRISMMNHYSGLSVQTLHSAYGGSGHIYHTITFTSGGSFSTRTLKITNTPASGQNTSNLAGTIYYGLAI